MATTSRAKKRKSNNPDGRPSQGIDEVRLLVPMPESLASLSAERASSEGVSRAKWIRIALRTALGVEQTECKCRPLETCEICLGHHAGQRRRT